MSKLEPPTPAMRNRMNYKQFTTLDRLQHWLDGLNRFDIKKIAEREAAIIDLNDIMFTAKEAFDIAHGQPPQGTPKRTPEQVTAAGMNVVEFHGLMAHYFEQTRSLFFESATGKQASNSSGSKEHASDRSLGDVQRLPNDAIRAFQKGVEKIRYFATYVKSQTELNEDWGYKPGGAGLKSEIQRRLEFIIEQEQNLTEIVDYHREFDKILKQYYAEKGNKDNARQSDSDDHSYVEA